MTSREIVYRTLNFDKPERVPRQIWRLAWAFMHHNDMIEKLNETFTWDIVKADTVYKETPMTVGDPCKVGEFIDEWGCVFENKQDGIVGEVKSPLITGEDWEDFDKAHIPTEFLSFDIDQINEYCANTDKFVLANANPRPFEQLQFLRGTENLYIDLAMESEGLKKAIRKIHEFYCELLNRWAKTDVDGLSISDDWGAQRSLLINPKTWVEVFKPLYQDYIDIAHSNGKKIFMHSDGCILEIMDHFVEMGLDAINSQLFCMGLENLEKYAGKITFWGEIDRQWLLPYGTKEDIVKAVEQVYNTLWRNGGCIAQCEFGIGANPENVYTVFEEWDKYK